MERSERRELQRAEQRLSTLIDVRDSVLIKWTIANGDVGSLTERLEALDFAVECMQKEIDNMRYLYGVLRRAPVTFNVDFQDRLP